MVKWLDIAPLKHEAGRRRCSELLFQCGIRDQNYLVNSAVRVAIF
jgi:hypothetical protein